MSTRLQWASLQVRRRLWFRATAFSAAAVAVALVATVVEPEVPAALSERIDTDAVGALLDILAASMLSVTIFSLTVVIAAHASATSNATPRSTLVLSEDNISHNALGTFVGGFIFSLVGMVALHAGLYDGRGRVTLYVVTLVVIGVIVTTLLRWIDHVSSMGRVGEITHRVETRTAEVLRDQRDCPYMGGRPLEAIPPDAVPLHAKRYGYVLNIDMGALQEAASAAGVQAYVTGRPGAFADPCQPLAWLAGGEPAETECDALREAFAIGDARTFDQDPRFGMIVLGEIASRALSAAMNDPGTAIDVLGRAVRLLAIAAGGEMDRGEVQYPDVHVAALDPRYLFDDVFTPIARDGASIVEVGVRLQAALRGLALLGDARFVHLAAQHSALALARAEQALEFEHDRERVRQAAAKVKALGAPDGPGAVPASGP